MSDSDFEVPADVEIHPDFYKRMRKANINLEKAFKDRKEFYEANEDSFFDGLTDSIKGFFGKYFSRK